MKTHFLVLLSLGSIILPAYKLTAQSILQKVVNNHTIALDCENMYQKPLDILRVRGWQEAILGVKQFVLHNAKKQKRFLLQCFDEIHKENEFLIHSIDTVYVTQKQGHIRPNICRQFSKNFERISRKMRRVEQGLYWVASNGDAETRAIEYVQKLAQYIAVTANKANRNLSIFG